MSLKKPGQKDLDSFYDAARTGDNEHIEKFLKEYGTNFIDTADIRGYTALMWAAWLDRPETVALLLDNGAFIDQKDNVGQTVLMGAAMNGRLDTVALLLKRGADFTLVDKYDSTAAMYARNNDHHHIAELIEKHRETLIKDSLAKGTTRPLPYKGPIIKSKKPKFP